MNPRKKVVVDISANGYGHLAQISPILRGMKYRFNLDIVIRSAIRRGICSQFLEFEFDHQPLLIDPNLKMLSPTKADIDGFYIDYKSLFLDNYTLIEDDARKPGELKADLLISNISAASLIAAKKANLTSIAISSLNWADIFEHYCIHLNSSKKILNLMKEAYNLSEYFIQLQPSLASTWINNRHCVPPIATQGINKKSSLVNDPKNHKLILVTLGGIPGGSEEIKIPKMHNTKWLVNEIIKNCHPSERQDIVNYELLDESFINLVASSDVVVSKCGYGIVTECARNNVKLMYALREDWPENPGLEAWAANHMQSMRITREELKAGNYENMLIDLMERKSQELKAFSDDSGINQVLDGLANYLN